MDDAALLRWYVNEWCESAFAELVERHIGMVYGAARRQLGGDDHGARDIAQEVFALLARKAPQLGEHPHLAGWLYTATRWRVRRHLRAQRRRERREQSMLLMPDNAPNWEQARPLLDDALADLRASERAVLVAHFFGRETYRAIGRRLSLTEDAARMRVERALEKLRRQLARRGIRSTGAALATFCATEGALAAPAGLAATVSSSAVAGAGAAGGATGLLAFMSANKVVWASLAAIGLLAVVSVHETALARQRGAQVAELTAERNTLRAEADARRATSPDAKPQARSVPTIGSGAVATTASSGTARPAAPAALARGWSVTTPLNFAVDHPEARAAFIEHEMLRAKAQFAHFFDQAGLTAAQRETLLQKFRDYAEAEFDYYAAVRSQGFGPMAPPQDPKALAGLLKIDFQITRSFDDAARQIIGDARMAELNEYVKALPGYNVADSLAARLYATDTPLTGAQAAQLAQALSDTPHAGDAPITMGGTAVSADKIDAARGCSNLANGTVIFPGHLDFSAPISDAAIQKAAAVLSPAQLAVLRELQAQQLATYQLTPSMPKGATAEQAIAAARKAGGQ